MMYINGSAAILPGNSPEQNGQVRAEEPDYTTLIPAAQLRRMSRIIKMGLWTGKAALQNSGLTKPGSVITATALGCNEDTEKFIRSYTDAPGNGSPTPFIQSTHNAVGGQIALALDCTGYNMTYTQRGFSFESALLDAQLRLAEGDEHVLCGAVDELTPLVTDLFRRMGVQRAGLVPGEATCFFVLSQQPMANCKGIISDVICRSELHGFMGTCLSTFEKSHATPENTVIITGSSADREFPRVLEKTFGNYPFASIAATAGYFPSDSAVAVWEGLRLLEEKQPGIQQVMIIRQTGKAYFRLIRLEKYTGV